METSRPNLRLKGPKWNRDGIWKNWISPKKKSEISETEQDNDTVTILAAYI